MVTMHTFAWPFHLALCVFAVSGVKLLSPSQLSQPTTVIYNDTPEQNHTPDYTVNDGSTDIPNYNDFTGTTIFDEIYVNKDTHGYDEKFGYNDTFDYSSTPDYNNKQDYSNPPDYSPKTPDYNSTSDYSTTSDHSTTSDYSTTSGHSTTLDYSRTSDYSSTPIFSSTYYYYFYDYNYTFYDYNYDDGFVLDVLKPILLDALEVCPSLNFCAIKQNSSFEEDRSARRDKYQKETNITFESLSSNNTSLTSRCCEDCSCLTTCLAVQNCCPDAPVFSRDFISFQANCLSAFYISRVSHSGRLPNIDYKTISWCKSSKKNFFGWRGSSTASFEEVVRVSVENRLYYNKETATCNGEAKLTRWELIAFDCVDDLYSLTLQGPKLEKYVLENCTVYSDPPDHINPTQFICSPYDTISHCNATGLWNKFDWDIEALCLSAGDYNAYDETGATYANVFCLMCNKPSGHKKPQKCKIQARRKQEIPKVGPSYRFIFDVEADTISNDRTEKGCSTLQVFDQYLGTCRDLLCPFQRLAYRGTCKQRQFVANNRLFPVVVKVKLSIPFPISSFKSSGGSLYGTFLKELNLTSNTFCRIQKSSMASFSNSFHGNVEFLLLSLAIRSSPACNEEWIAEFIDLRQTPTSTRVNVEGVQVPVTMETSLQQYPAEILYRKTVLFTYGEDCTDCYTVTIGRLFCPHVKLSKSEYCLVQKKLHDSNLSTCHSGTLSVNENFVMDQNVETGISADIFYMCWSDYERLAGKVNDNIVNGGSSGRNISSVHLFLFMYISLVVRYLVPLLCSYRI